MNSRYGIFSNGKFLYPISKHACCTTPTSYPEDASSKLFRNISITYQFALHFIAQDINLNF